MQVGRYAYRSTSMDLGYCHTNLGYKTTSENQLIFATGIVFLLWTKIQEGTYCIWVLSENSGPEKHYSEETKPLLHDTERCLNKISKSQLELCKNGGGESIPPPQFSSASEIVIKSPDVWKQALKVVKHTIFSHWNQDVGVGHIFTLEFMSESPPPPLPQPLL